MDHIDSVEFKAAIEGFIDMATVHARGVMTYYRALVSEGFSEAQALQIVLKHGYMPPMLGGGNIGQQGD